jgi:hypothetical protein
MFLNMFNLYVEAFGRSGSLSKEIRGKFLKPIVVM